MFVCTSRMLLYRVDQNFVGLRVCTIRVRYSIVYEYTKFTLDTEHTSFAFTRLHLQNVT